MNSSALALVRSPATGRTAHSAHEPLLRALSDAELLGLLLSRGRLQESAVDLARHLLAQLGGLAALPSASPALLRHHGLRDTQISVLLAAREIACRIARQDIPGRELLERPGTVARFLTLRYRQRDQASLRLAELAGLPRARPRRWRHLGRRERELLPGAYLLLTRAGLRRNGISLTIRFHWSRHPDLNRGPTV
jgi:hypothetical protein